MILKKQYYALWFLLLLVPCFHSTIAQNVNIKKLRINPESAVGGRIMKYIDTISYVPLENNNDNVLSDILQLELSKNFYLILNNRDSCILIFDKSGKLHGRVNSRRIIYRFNYDKNRKLIEIIEFPYFLEYDLNGYLVDKKKMYWMPVNQFGVTKMDLDSNLTAFFNTSKKSNDSLIYEVLIYDKKGNKRNAFMPFPSNYKKGPFDEFGFKNFVLNSNKKASSIYYMHAYDYTIYVFNNGNLLPSYQFIFPYQYSLPKEFYKLNYTKRELFLEQNNNVIVRLFSFFKDGNNIFFHTGQAPYLYNTQSGHLIDIDKIISDSMSYNLPITPYELNSGSAQFLNYDGDCIYLACPANCLFKSAKKFKNNYKKYPSNLREFLQNKKNMKGNSVLIKIRFKQNI